MVEPQLPGAEFIHPLKPRVVYTTGTENNRDVFSDRNSFALAGLELDALDACKMLDRLFDRRACNPHLSPKCPVQRLVLH